VRTPKTKSQLLKSNCGFFSRNILLASCLLLLVHSCGNRKDDNLTMLSPVASYDIDIPETSDLCFGFSTDILYTVSDNTAKAYKISTKGRVLSELQYTGSDLEGICYVDNQFIYVVEERLREICKLDLQGNLISQKVIPIDQNEENEGLEGIAFAPFNQHFYIINEMNPDLLVETDKELNVLSYYPLSFANDYSGICVDNSKQELWIVSDMSATVNRCSMTGELIENFRIPVYNAEGIAFDSQNGIIYVVSDAESKLYVFSINNQ